MTKRSKTALKEKPSKPAGIQAPSKKDAMLKLLTRPKGASLKELMNASGWLAHSVRGFLSGTVRKKLGLNLVSETNEKGDRHYRILEDEGVD